MCIKDHYPEFAKLAKHLREHLNGQRAIYMANPGNLGDALIRRGTLEFFEHFKIPYREIRQNYFLSKRNCLKDAKLIDMFLPFFCKSRLLIYGGGGGFLPQYAVSNLVRQLTGKFRNIFILPSTLGMQIDFTGKDIFYAREKETRLRFAREAYLCHDMAFFIGKVPSENPTGKYGNFFRLGSESIFGDNPPNDNHDLSLDGTTYSDTKHLFDVLDQYGLIRTDRLHLCIAACLMGKKVHFYPNSYFKNKAVYEHSISNFFPSCRFISNDRKYP